MITLNVFMVFLCFVEYCNSKGLYNNLLKDLFDDYNPSVRPITKLEETIEVGIQFGIIQLLNVVDKSKTIECVTFMSLTWKDELLRWNPENYNNITQFRIRHYHVWKPDIILTNTPDLNDGTVMDKASTNVIISSDGTIENAFTSRYEATCQSMDMKNFPFDYHNCYFDFASWTYSQAELDLYDASNKVEGSADSMKLLPNAEWDLVITGREKLVENDTCENQSYPTWRIKVTLTRKPLYFLVNILIPITITCYIAFLGMFSPSSNTGERTEKASIGITTLLAVSLLMLTVSAQMPVTSNAVPLLGYFLGVYILTVAVAIICTNIIMRIDVHGLNGRPLPKCLKTIFLKKIGKWLKVYYEKEKCKIADEKKFDSHIKNDNVNPLETLNEKFANLAEFLTSMQNILNMCSQTQYALIMKAKCQKEEYRRIRKEWSQLSTVLDIICLTVFLTWSTIFTILVLSN